MKKLFLLGGFAALIAMSTTTTSCNKDETVDPPIDTTSNERGTDAADYKTASVSRTSNNNSTYREPANDELSSDITYNTVLKTGKTYTLKNFVYVRWGATLKIEPGVTIKGDKGSKASLVITRNGKIDAQGTASQPIIFTSAQSTPTRGDWGGIIILGNARNNGAFQGTSGIAQIEGGVNNDAGYGLHGGTNDGDNSGIMKYVRIEYPGIAFQPDNEINGLTMGSVGSGTTIDYVEVYYSGDDAFEWFGGTVNAKHLISVACTDDDYDTDFGYSGKVQFGISVRDNQQADFAANGTSNGFESDNDASGTTATPRTSAVFSNMTMVGPRAQNGTPAAPFGRGAHIRRNSAQSIFNSAFIGWNTGIRIDGNATAAAFQDGTAEFKNNFVANASRVSDSAGVTGSGIFNTQTFFNTTGGNTAEIGSTAAFLATQTLGSSFNPTPASGSVLLSGAAFSSGKLSGMENVSYRGAVGSTNWTSGWAKF